MAGNVDLRLEGDNVTLARVIDDTAAAVQNAALRRRLGDGMIRDGRGRVQYRHTLAIPVDEFQALLDLNDADALAWWNDHGDDRALRRLVLRYPHWKVCDGRL